MSKNHRAMGLIIVVILALVWSQEADCGRRRLNLTSRAEDLPADWQAEAWFGRQLAARILGNIALWDQPAANRYVNLVGSAVALFAPAPGVEFTFGILDSDRANAYAAPGGYIFITRGALAKMADEAELAAVLGHEIAHVACHHMTKSLGLYRHQDSALGGLAALVGGATGSYRQAIARGLAQAMDMLMDQGYRRKDELEADRLGVQLAAMAGYRPDGLVSFLSRVRSFEPAATTGDGRHPRWKVRIAALRGTQARIGTGLQGSRSREERFNEVFNPLFGADNNLHPVGTGSGQCGGR